MTAFSAAMATIFADPNMAADALWLVQGFGPGVPCRIIRRAPDQLSDFGQARLRSTSTIVDVRQAEVATPVRGDILVIGSDRFKVQADPVQDSDRLIWTLDLVPQ